MSAATLRHIMRDSSTPIHNRGVAQPGSAPPWGGGGRRFKSSRPDQHPRRGARIPGPSSSVTPGVRRLRVSPSRPDQLASLRFQLHSQGQGRPSLVCPFSGTNVQWTFVTAPPHPRRGARIPGPSSSVTPGVRRLRVSPSRPDQSCYFSSPFLASDFVCAPRTIEKLIAGGSAPAPWATFLCPRKEKSPKESAPPGLRPAPRTGAGFPRAALASAGAPTRHPCRGGARAGILPAPLRAGTSAACGARLDQGGWKTPPRTSLRCVAHTPVWCARASQLASGFSRASCSSPGRVVKRPASWGARRCRREAQGVVAPSGACFFWVLFFARAKKSTSPAVREPQLQIRGRRPLN